LPVIVVTTFVVRYLLLWISAICIDWATSGIVTFDISNILSSLIIDHLLNNITLDVNLHRLELNFLHR
ncbi:hypothetical protein ACJX0J_037801, partial [Zea mays]